LSRRGAAALAALLLGFAAFPLLADAAGEAPPPAAFHLAERSDFSRYIDGKYLGHLYREARGSLAAPADSEGGAAGTYEGEFLILEETLRDMKGAARRVEGASPVRLSVARGGGLELQVDSGYPSLRGLPALPKDFLGGGRALELGEIWTAPGTRALDLEHSGSFILMPFLAEYRYRGMAEYRGRKAIGLTAKFATRWKEVAAKAGPASEGLKSATGTHDLDILVDAESLSTLFVRDRFDETFVLSGAAGRSERRSGFSLLFFEDGVPLDRRGAGEAMVAAVKEALPPGAGPGPLIAGEGPALAEAWELAAGGALDAAGLELDTSPEGLILRVKDLRFVADSDAILGTELWRLDAIAAALKSLPSRSFQVAGHSAAVGKAAGELELSIRRAKRVTDELAARGIEASRLLYRGFGSSLPLAPNDSEEGRARNRRVEITILD
jgi:OmpA-OmpF porin, OOP family